jgi:hypothetical protein
VRPYGPVVDGGAEAPPFPGKDARAAAQKELDGMLESLSFDRKL